ncbi:hypothetical protein [Singulisphaera sp. PoT]|uniref:hypothetical protein n=1 Tax=Singulisphaera sp. PoT TaxID=3411797 RepID=UPI003BF5B0EE
MLSSYVIQVADATKPLYFIGPEQLASGKPEGVDAEEPTPHGLSLRAVKHPLFAERFVHRVEAEHQASRYAADEPELRFFVLEIIAPI